MSKLPKWFERVFSGGLDVALFPNLCARLEGTPARVEELLARVPDEVARERFEGEWSIVENAGHLTDLEPLWLGRVDDLLAGTDELRPADLTNATTHAADHNAQSNEAIGRAFRTARSQLMTRLEALSDTELARSAKHPRLGTPMGFMELCAFVAEHDDQHIARMREIERAATS